MAVFEIGQTVRVVNAMVNVNTPPTFATVTGQDEKFVYAKISENGPAYSYYPNMLEAVTEEVAIEEVVAHKESGEASSVRAQETIDIPASFVVDARWHCQECGHVWSGANGNECPRCGEQTMITSPRGRE